MVHPSPKRVVLCGPQPPMNPTINNIRTQLLYYLDLEMYKNIYSANINRHRGEIRDENFCIETNQKSDISAS